MNWRPEEWTNYCSKGFKYGGWTPPDEYTRRVCAGIYEASADAMLEALKKHGLYVKKGDICPPITCTCNGTLVFIPDDK